MAGLTPAPAATVTVEPEPGARDVAVVRVAGEIDASNVPILEEAVAALLLQAPTRVIFDLSTLDFMDSAGLAVLITTAASAATVEVRNPTSIIRRVLERTGLTTVLHVIP